MCAVGSSVGPSGLRIVRGLNGLIKWVGAQFESRECWVVVDVAIGEERMPTRANLRDASFEVSSIAKTARDDSSIDLHTHNIFLSHSQEPHWL